MAKRDIIYITGPGPLVEFWATLGAASKGTYTDGCLSIAKGAAYSGLLSFFPLLTTLAAILVQVRADAVARNISTFLFEVVPPGTDEVVRNLFVVHGSRPKSLLVIAILLAAYAASGVMISLMEGFRSIYHIPAGRPFLKERGVALALVFCSVIPLWSASALIVAGTRSEQLVMAWLRVIPEGSELSGWISLVGSGLRFAIALGSVVVVTTLVYYIGPNRKQSLQRVLPGAVLATVLWLLATGAFAWWVRHVAQYNLLYGSVGAGLALLVWMYLLAVISLFGCEFNAVREAGRGPDA